MAARRRRKSYRRNQPRQLRGIVRQLTDGAVGAFQILTGKALARAIPEMVGMPKEGPTGIAIQGAVAIFAGMMARQFFGAEAGKMVLAGALTAPVETLIVTANIPVISPALSAYPMLSAYPEYDGAYGVLAPGAGMSAYPTDISMDEAYG